MYLRFFFFKLKTAYEMRISDWSSGVCSSDLHFRHDRVVVRIPVGHGLAGLDRRAVLDRDGGAVRQLVAPALAAVGVEHGQLARARGRDQAALGEIGRGEGRERVCMSVVISSVAGTLQKKFTISHSQKN